MIEVEVGTPKWKTLTRRRYELIHKKCFFGGLSETEKSELDQLNEASLAAINRRFPYDNSNMKKLDELEELLRSEKS